MFESDDFDQVLSHLDFEDVSSKPNNENEKKVETPNNLAKTINVSAMSTNDEFKSLHQTNNKIDKISPKHVKRKIVKSHFDNKSKRKFPGPAGLLIGNLEESNDQNICQMELLSQDIDFTQNNLRKDIFGSPMWITLLDNIQSWNLSSVDSIKYVKEQAMTGNLRKRKADVITAFIETIDRSVTDPLIMLRDTTGTIKCTLHRDAWSKFASYIAAEYCAFVLWKPTVLTTGSAFKKHYLNITLSNILAIYSSALLQDEMELPDGYSVVYQEDFTVIKTENYLKSIGTNITLGSNDTEFGDNDLFDDLDNIFSHELF